MLRDVFEICATYIQYLMLLFQVTSAAFPDFFTSPVDILQYVNLDLLSVFDESSRYRNTLNITIPVWIPLDFRLQFVVVSVVGPLIISIAGMFFLGTKVFFVWFMLLLGGAFVLIISTTSKLNASLVKESIIDRDSVSIAFTCGIAVTSTMVVCGLVVYVWRTLMQAEISEQEQREMAEVVDADMQDRDAEIELQLGRHGRESHREQQNTTDGAAAEGGDGNDGVSRKERLDHIMQLETSELDVVAVVTRALYFTAFFITGLIFSRVIPLGAFDSNLFYALSGVVLFIAVSLLVWLLLGLFRSGREFQFSISVWIRDNFVSMLLLLVSVVYTPAVTDIISVYSCAEVTCAAGYHLPVAMSVMASSPKARYSATTGSTACFACNFSQFNPQQCPASLQAALCGNMTSESRLTADVGVPCSDVGGFFIAAASIMLASFVVTLPIVYFLLTDQSTRTLDTEFPLDNRQIEGYTEEEVHTERVHVSENVAKFIFDPFVRRFQQWRLLVMFQKIILVIITIMAQGEGSVGALRSGAVGIGLSLAVHLAYLLYVLFSVPFQRRIENILTATTQVILCSVCAAALTDALAEHTIPEAVWICIAVVVVAGPFLAIIVGAVLTFKDEVLREREREERVRLAQQSAEDADEPAKASLVRRLSSDGAPSPRGISGIGLPRQHTGTTTLRVDSDGGTTPSSPQSSEPVGGASSPSSSIHVTASSPRFRKKQLFAHPRPKLEIPTESSEQAGLCNGSQGPLFRYHRLPQPAAQDSLGRTTLISKIRFKYQQLAGSVSIGVSTIGPRSGSGRNLLATAKAQSEGNQKYLQHHAQHTTAFARGPLAAVTSPLERNVFGAASVNIRQALRRNTAAESARAQENWATAKLAVLAHIRDERELAKKSFRGRQKSFMIGSNKKIDKLRGKGKQWDHFLSTLLTGEEANSARPPLADADQDGRSAVVSPTVSVPSSVTETQLSPQDGTSPQGKPSRGAPRHTTAPPAGENLQIESMDPLQRAKERKRARARGGADGASSMSLLTASLDLDATTTLSSTANSGGMMERVNSDDSPVRTDDGNGVLSPVQPPSSVSDHHRTPASGKGGVDEPPEDVEDHFRAIQGGAAGRRRHILLRLKLQAIYDKQLKKLQLTQQAVDFRINKDTIFVLNNFFVFLGLFALVALALSCIGAISTANERFFTGVLFNEDMSASSQFVGYGTWANFTSHCCCVGSADQTPEWPFYVVDVEEWFCDNGNIKERIRRSFIDGVLRSGLGVRGLCATAFSDGCSASVDSSGAVNITGCSTSGRPFSYEKLLW